MPLRRLLGLSAGAVSGRFRCSFSTVPSHPPWAMIHNFMPPMVRSPELGASVALAEPPQHSHVFVPEHLLNTSSRPDSDGDVAQVCAGQVYAASGDGHLLLSYLDVGVTAPVRGKRGAREALGDGLNITRSRFVCNPLSTQLFLLPDISGSVKEFLGGCYMGLLTQADRGHGPPDRFAVAMLHGDKMLRFVSETGEWDSVVAAPYQLPGARPMATNQEVLDFDGRLWWVDVTWGAISADPFTDRPEPRIVELPRGSVLPARTQKEQAPEKENVSWYKELARYRRMGVSEGKLLYAEVSRAEPFVLSSFVLDDEERSGWTLEHRVALSRLWADGGHPWLPLQSGATPQICVLDPFNASVMYLSVGRHFVAVDMLKGEVIASSVLDDARGCLPCVLPPWLGSSRIPSAGKKHVVKNKTLADVLVRSDRHQEK